MKPWAEPAIEDAVPLPLADGIGHYVELFLAQPASADLPTMRLNGDLAAGRFAQGFAPRVDRYDTAIAADGREIPLRIFDPGGDGLRPAFCYFHGGGFSMGSIESFDIACAALAEATGAVVASVHYRRLPEADYAAAQDDCDQAYAWLARQAATLRVDPARIGLAGDSAGALFAIACAANARDAAAARSACMLLFYGAYSMDPERAEYAGSRDPLLTGERIRHYIALFRRSGGLDGRAAPIDRSDLAGLPPTHIVAAEFDPLCGEAQMLAERLRAAGVPTTLRVASGMIHGFLRAVGVSPDARRELALASDVARALIGPGSRETDAD